MKSELIYVASVNYETMFIFDIDGNFVVYNKDGYRIEKGHFSASELEAHIFSKVFRKFYVQHKVIIGLFNNCSISFIARARAWVNRVLGTKWFVPTAQDVLINQKIDQKVWNDIINSYVKDMHVRD